MAEGGFTTFAVEDVRDLVGEHPLAWVIASAAAEPTGSLLPLIGQYDADGRLVALIGHFARRNPLMAALTAQPAALILINGPQGYVSPEHAGLPGWGPTWNYAQLMIEAEVTLDPDLTAASLDLLIDPLERDRADPWRKELMGARYAGMFDRIIGFRAKVTGLRGTFKLGQDEAPETLRAILARHPDRVLTRWMRRFNAARL